LAENRTGETAETWEIDALAASGRTSQSRRIGDRFATDHEQKFELKQTALVLLTT
jgi:hypothetical protein